MNVNKSIKKAGRSFDPTELQVLHIVSYPDATFFREQIDELESRGVTCDILAGQECTLDQSKIIASLPKRFVPDERHNIGNYAYNAVKFHPKLLSTSVRNEYDVIHVNSGLMAPFAFLQPQKPIVVSFWGSDLLGEYLAGLFPYISKFCAQLSDANIVMSEEMAGEIDDTDCYVIPHGIDLNKFEPIDRQTAIEQTGWNEDEVNILFPYNPSRKEKNVDMARAVSEEVEKRIDDTVSFNIVCNVPHDDMPMYMNAADLMLVTSDHEGFPNTVKEAMACNLPIVSRDVGDIKKRLRTVDHSYVCNSFEELVNRTEDVLRANGRSNGRPHVRELGKERMGDQLLDVYDRVIPE